MREDAIFRIFSMTKPITGVAMLILYEEGRYLLTDPVAGFLPEFGAMEVYAPGAAPGPGPAVGESEPARPMTIQHLLTHTSGLVYNANEEGLPGIYRRSEIWSAATLEEFTRRVAELPLDCEPGSEWNYGVSMDVLGRLVEVLSGQPFDRFLEERIFEPLGMVDTAFYVPEEKLSRLAASYGATAGKGLERRDPNGLGFRDPGTVPYGGHGLVSTAADYLRFAQMLVNGGELDGFRVLGRKTVELMMSDHLGPQLGAAPLDGFDPWLPGSPAGFGFGLSGAVLRSAALAAVPGSVGDFSWGGAASTYFWVDPEEELVGLFLTQLAPSDTYPLRALMRVLTYQAIID